MRTQSITPGPSPFAWLLQHAKQPPAVQNRLEPLLSTTETAKFLNVCGMTVRRMLKRGTLRAVRTDGKRGRYRIPRSEVERVFSLREQTQ